jgi:GT2 family glycosyltransferase
VVAVVVVHEPGDWFEETLDALAEQDYPSLRFLFLVTGDADSAVPEQAAIGPLISHRLPDAFVRHLGTNPGFGPAANEVLRLVEGRNGFFLMCHDDIAPEPEAVRVMVEEIYRSNAGVVAPKIVEWERPDVLASVGLGLDRFGEVSNAIEADEVDQEQHDGVRDVFVASSACMLVRADLFRELDGFDPALELWGEDVEFCWRVHHSGARVVVAPTARVRHRGQLPDRRVDLNHSAISARHRLRTVTTLTGGARLPGRVLELLVLTVAQLVVGLFTGRFRDGVDSLRAFVGLVFRLPLLLGRRRVVRSGRRVPESEVLGLQERGSARLVSYLRSRDTAVHVGSGASVRRWRESTTAPVFAWIAVLALFVLGSRSLLAGGIPAVGDFLTFPSSPRDLLTDFANGWNSTGTGSTSANPTGLAALSMLSVTTLFRMGLLQTVFVLGLVVVGLIGLWKLATVFPSTRARLGALAIYAASPLVGGALATGSLDVLITYATIPWFVHTLRRAVGVETADPRAAQDDLADALVQLSWGERLQRTAQASLVVALGAAFDPIVVPIAVVVAVLLAVGTLVALAPWQTALGYLGVGATAVVVGVSANLPWSATWDWNTIVGPSPVGDPSRGLRSLASFEIGPTDFVSLALALYLPVVAALLLAQAWRLTWAVRSGLLVVGFGALAVFGDRGGLPVEAPGAGVLLVPVAIGLALSGAAALAAFDLDVRGGSFGWRQPLGLAASLAIVIGVVPGVLGAGAGDWDMPSTPLSRLIDARLPDVPADGSGDYHVLVLGDARLLPVPAAEYRDGVSFAVIDDDGLDVTDTFPATGGSDAAITSALDQIAIGSTQRAGRLLAPLGIRYVVIPEFDGVVSTTSAPLELPTGLVGAFDEQLDIVSVVGLPTVEFFENSSWIPTFSQLTGPTAEASRSAGDEALVRADLTSATAIFSGADSTGSFESQVDVGVVHLAVPFDANWTLTVDGTELAPRRAFGLTTAFDVDEAGTAVLAYRTPGSRSVLLGFQALLWLVIVFVATRVNVPLGSRGTPAVRDETLIELDDSFDESATAGETLLAAFDPGLDLTGEISRVALEEATVDTLEDLAGVASPDVVPGGIDEVPWVDELMENAVPDPLDVRADEEGQR